MKQVQILAILLALTVVGAAEQRPRSGKPVLLRDDRTQQDKPDETEIIIHDPEMARQNVEIGDFYLKRGNLKAATERYRLAVEYNRQWPESYNKLVRVLEKQRDFAAALQVCKEFVEGNPAAKETSHFREKQEKLEARLEKE